MAEAKDMQATWKSIETTQQFISEPTLSETPLQGACTRFVLMSDTHGKHRNVKLPKGDVLVHAGDFTKFGEVDSISDLNKYFQESGFEQVICIAGNHDITFEEDFYETNWSRFHEEKQNCRQVQQTLSACTYLRDSSCRTNKGGLEVYGSPWTPEFFNWAFNLPRGDSLRKKWENIPASTDILITHGPPLGRKDMTRESGRVGCYDLLQQIQSRIKPRLHIFGHIHEDPGVSFDGVTLYCNAANCDLMYRARRPCIVIDVPHDKSKPAVVVDS